MAEQSSFTDKMEDTSDKLQTESSCNKINESEDAWNEKLNSLIKKIEPLTLTKDGCKKKKCVDKLVSCDICGKNFGHRKQLKTHKFLHDVQKEKCQNCGEVKTFDQCPNSCLVEKNENLKRNLKIQLRYDEFQSKLRVAFNSKECKPIFCVFKPRLDQKNSFNTKKSVQNDQCAKNSKFVSSWLINPSDPAPLQAESVKCKKCGKKLGTESDLKVHMQVHLNSKRLMCKFCGVNFSERIRLKIHVKTVHLDVSKCAECGKNISSLHKLRKHLLVHKLMQKNSSKLKCEKCKKQFTNKKGMNIHVCGLSCRRCGAMGDKQNFKDHRGLYKSSENRCKVCGETNINEDESNFIPLKILEKRNEINPQNLKVDDTLLPLKSEAQCEEKNVEEPEKSMKTFCGIFTQKIPISNPVHKDGEISEYNTAELNFDKLCDELRFMKTE